MSAHVPSTRNGGDRETIDDLRGKYSFCRDDQIEDIKCRVIGQRNEPLYFGQNNITCDLDNGLVCYNDDQEGDSECLDYEISFKCGCE